MYKYILVALFIFILSCEEECEEYNSTQCNNDKIEICTSDNQWEEAYDCGRAEKLYSKEKLVCCEIDGEAECREDCNN